MLLLLLVLSESEPVSLPSVCVPRSLPEVTAPDPVTPERLPPLALPLPLPDVAQGCQNKSAMTAATAISQPHPDDPPEEAAGAGVGRVAPGVDEAARA